MAEYRETVPEAPLERSTAGAEATGDGWFVLNVADAVSHHNEQRGHTIRFEGQPGIFGEIGINIRILDPGQPACLYHRESQQEDFLVLSGECIAIVEGQERTLKAWDFLHCPAWTRHVIVGGGSGPSAVLMVGARNEDEQLEYPVNEVAEKYRASARETTGDPSEAYAHWSRERTRTRPPWPPPPEA